MKKECIKYMALVLIKQLICRGYMINKTGGDILGNPFEELSNESPQIIAVLGRNRWV